MKSGGRMLKPVTFIPTYILLSFFAFSQNAFSQSKKLSFKILTDNTGNGNTLNLVCSDSAKTAFLNTKLWISTSEPNVFKYKDLVHKDFISVLTTQMNAKAISLGCSSNGISGSSVVSTGSYTESNTETNENNNNKNANSDTNNSQKANFSWDPSISNSSGTNSRSSCNANTHKCTGSTGEEEIKPIATKTVGVQLPSNTSSVTGPDGSTINTISDPNTGITRKDIWSKGETTNGVESGPKLQESIFTDSKTGKTISGASDDELLQEAKHVKPPEARERLEAAIKGKKVPQTADEEGQKDQASLESKGATFKQNARTLLDQLSSQIDSMCMHYVQTSTYPYQKAEIDQNCRSEIREAIFNGSNEKITDSTGNSEDSENSLLQKKGIIRHLNSFEYNYASCTKDAPFADKICSATRNDTTRSLSQGLTLASSVLQSLGGAEMCKVTSSASLIGQGIFLAAGLACESTRLSCIASCGGSNSNLNKMDKRLTSIEETLNKVTRRVNPTTPPEIASIKKLIAETKVSLIDPEVATCKKHAASTKDLVTTATGLASAYAQAKDCTQKLNALDANNAALSSVSAAAGCNDPSNATYSTQTCVCQRDNTAYGCAGYAGSINGGAVGKIGSASGVSQMAGATTGTKGLNDSGSALDGLGSSDNGWNGIGGNPSADKQDLAFGKAGGASTSGGGGGGAGGSPSSASGEHLGEEPNKEGLAGKYGNALGGGFGGRGGGATGKAIQNQKYSEAQLAAARRKLASDQASNQVSPASGFSNWDKVKTRYLENKSTLIGN